ncbi:MAG: transcription termination/antitermination NusG family protein [Eubacteriales bacterium]
MEAYCAFCRTNREENAAMQINRLYASLGMQAIVPVRIIKERCRGALREVRKPLLPGYVLIYSNFHLRPSMIRSVEDVIKLLCYPGGEYALNGEDLAYANFVHINNGVIGISDILCEGKEVKVLSGPLEELNGTIIKLDRRKQRVLMRVRFDGLERDISLSANIVTAV